jgi:hypothetical protein
MDKFRHIKLSKILFILCKHIGLYVLMCILALFLWSFISGNFDIITNLNLFIVFTWLTTLVLAIPYLVTLLIIKLLKTKSLLPYGLAGAICPFLLYFNINDISELSHLSANVMKIIIPSVGVLLGLLYGALDRKIIWKS